MQFIESALLMVREIADASGILMFRENCKGHSRDPHAQYLAELDAKFFQPLLDAGRPSAFACEHLLFGICIH